MKPIITVFVHVLGLGTAASATFLFQYLNCVCEYRRGLGLQNWSPVPLLYPLEWLLVAVVYICAVLLYARVAGTQVKALSLLLGAGVAFILALGLFFSTGTPPVRYYLDGFEKRVKGQADIATFTDWKTKVRDLTGESRSSRVLKKHEYPEFLLKIVREYPPRVSVVFGDDGRAKYLMITWGGGFQVVGIIVNLHGRYPMETTPFLFKQWLEDTYFFVGG